MNSEVSITRAREARKKTLGEMRAGYRANYKAFCWGVADDMQRRFNERWKVHNGGIFVRVQDYGGVLMLETSIEVVDRDPVIFPRESVDNYPSEELITKLMLVCG